MCVLFLRLNPRKNKNLLIINKKFLTFANTRCIIISNKTDLAMRSNFGGADMKDRKTDKSKTAYVYILKGVLIIATVVILVISFSLFPELVRGLIEDYHPNLAWVKLPLTLVYATGIAFFELILFFTYRICDQIMHDNSFSVENVNNLKSISICAAADALLVVVMALLLSSVILMHPAITTLLAIVFFACTIVFLLAGVLSKLLSMANELKNENDLTI